MANFKFHFSLLPYLTAGAELWTSQFIKVKKSRTENLLNASNIGRGKFQEKEGPTLKEGVPKGSKHTTQSCFTADNFFFF